MKINRTANKANKRKSFIIYKDSLSVLKKLKDEQAGKLFKAIAEYQEEETLPKDDLISIIFEPFLNQFIRDDENYLNTCEARRNAGAKGGKQKLANASKRKQKLANLADSENDSDSDSDSENENDSKNELIDIYQELADGLKFILEAKLARTIRVNGWKEEIRKLIEIDLKPRNNPLADVKRAIQAISDHSGKQYFPIVQSASSLREKFTKIENFLNKLNPKQTNSMDEIFNNIMEKYENE